MDTEDVDSDELREDDTFQVSDSDEEFEFDKPKTAPRKKPMTKAVIDSDDESPPKKPKKTQPPPSVSSDDLFDSLIGKTTPKKDEEPPKKDQEPPKKPPVKDVFALGTCLKYCFQLIYYCWEGLKCDCKEYSIKESHKILQNLRSCIRIPKKHQGILLNFDISQDYQNDSY